MNLLSEWRVDGASKPKHEEYRVGSERTHPMQVIDDEGKNRRATILREIAHIRFTHLTLLAFQGNQIESIEGLHSVQMPNIQILRLNNNRITLMRVIRKAVWPCLQGLSLDENSFRDAKCLDQSSFPEIKSLEVYCSYGDGGHFTEQCFVSKMQAPSLTYLSINKYKFCFNRSIERVLKQKWRSIFIS